MLWWPVLSIRIVKEAFLNTAQVSIRETSLLLPIPVARLSWKTIRIRDIRSRIWSIYEPHTKRTSYMNHIRNFKKIYRFSYTNIIFRIWTSIVIHIRFVYGELVRIRCRVWIVEVFMFYIRFRIWMFILVPVHIRCRIWRVGLYTMSYMDVRANDKSSISDCLNSRKLCFSYSLFLLTSVGAKCSF